MMCTVWIIDGDKSGKCDYWNWNWKLELKSQCISALTPLRLTPSPRMGTTPALTFGDTLSTSTRLLPLGLKCAGLPAMHQYQFASRHHSTCCLLVCYNVASLSKGHQPWLWLWIRSPASFSIGINYFSSCQAERSKLSRTIPRGGLWVNPRMPHVTDSCWWYKFKHNLWELFFAIGDTSL